MIKRLLFGMLLLFIGGFVSGGTTVFAFGIGPYVETTQGSGSYIDLWDDGDSYHYGYDDSIDVNATGFGLVMDSNLSQDKLFNYRLSLGYSKLEVPESMGDDVDGHRFSMEHTFGFGLIKTEAFRFWMGPQIHLSYSRWDVPVGRYYLEQEDIDFIGWGVGLVTGGNFNLPGVGSICPEIGVRYQTNASDTYEESDDDGWYDDTYEVDYSYSETVVFFKVSMMFGD